MLGPPGSGKGTQAERITADYKIPAISTGDIFRKNLSEKTELGVKAGAYMQKGELVPDDLVIALIVDRLLQDDTKNGYLLDGFPRTIAQADALEKILRENGEQIDHVIYINANKELLVQRIVNRKVCKSCGKTYNVGKFAPKQDGVCDVCGGELITRSDDNEATVINRIDVYNEQTKPLVEYYEKKGLLSEFDGSEEFESVYEGVRKLLG
jgi:adenylate kinase